MAGIETMNAKLANTTRIQMLRQHRGREVHLVRSALLLPLLPLLLPLLQ